MSIGQAIQILISVPNLEESLIFYHKLGFKKLDGNAVPSPWALLSDGVMLFLLNQNAKKYLGMAYFAEDMGQRVKELEAAGIKMATKNEHEGTFVQAVGFDPNGFGISFIQSEVTSLARPPGKGFVSCGGYFEISIPAEDVPRSVLFWEKLGFKKTYGDSSGKTWASLSDGLTGVGLYTRAACNHKFPIPAVTYFSGDSAQRIQKMKKDGIRFIENIPNKDGIIADAIAESPEGQHFFCFNGEF